MSKPAAAGDHTFRSYSSQDAKNYAQIRLHYSEALYKSITDYHTSTGGQLGTVVDLGCGPGIATFKLADYFASVTGLDHSKAMIETARDRLATEDEKVKSAVRFEVSTAEDIDPALVPDGSVDVITAATCAHWFDMPRFWPTAARILKPGGTVAIWCSQAANAHHSVPNAAKINATLEKMVDTELDPYFEPGNRLARNMYADLRLPWTVDPPEPAFDQASFQKKFFGFQEGDDPFFEGSVDREFDLDMVEKLLSTSSPVTRWREAHPELVGTEDDIVRRMRRVIEENLREAGVAPEDFKVKGGRHGLLLTLKKRA
ncbi:S-adenosyl-L-methionine-dependent methyltransferase [Cryphonectria parasitica EP155]|uniref:S-adenosyl-L-methionine-dependent methyltransferase n=1 Tax=Cryphonectria parasitica (strain ATCC 38755 / EP155) TaxID=660469 RepID=A0A9P4XUP2_CRYP1|nr:S-adenosyl-L-methionine-dependent methyltransferase [Cryphonectria parasitica EP155]KAF3761619.1 S-adenosyl-L-methionine-dependent methyltransferase [Cryphonectria parasitica EP155]